jgi:NADH dehydrogenase
LSKTLTGLLACTEPQPFIYRDYGSLVSFSKYSAVGNMTGSLQGKSMFIDGRIARLFYVSLYRMHQVAIHGFLRTALIWLSDKITTTLGSRMKLH